jgi:hypothetical protein
MGAEFIPQLTASFSIHQPSPEQKAVETEQEIRRRRFKSKDPEKLLSSLVASTRKHPQNAGLVYAASLYIPEINRVALRRGLTLTKFDHKQGTGTAILFNK